MKGLLGRLFKRKKLENLSDEINTTSENVNFYPEIDLSEDRIFDPLFTDGFSIPYFLEYLSKRVIAENYRKN